MSEKSRLINLEALKMRGDFIRRHIGSDRHQIKEIVDYLGLDTLEDVLHKAVPESIVTRKPLSLTNVISERAIITHMRKMRERNHVLISMIGMGYYGTIMPEVIKRNVL